MHNSRLAENLMTDSRDPVKTPVNLFKPIGGLDNKFFSQIHFVMLFLLSVILTSAHAVEVSLSGFLSITGGQVINGSRNDSFNGVECPCFISDWNHFGIYNKKPSFTQESRAGFRANTKINEALSAVVQVDGRAQNGGKGSLEWAYLSYEPAQDWTVLIGRRRIPIYFYSDFMDVGFAYPWVRPPQDLYGWEFNNFNGFTVAKVTRWNDWSARASVFLGREESSDNRLTRYSFPNHPALVWDHVQGADLELTHDWLNMRIVFIRSTIDISNSAEVLFLGARQRIYGWSGNIDYNNWIVKSELSIVDRFQDIGYRSKAGFIAFGYSLGDYTPLLTYSHFADANNYSAPNWKSRNVSLSLRYDVNATTAFKVQLDQLTELSSPNSTTGDANIISVSLDKVF
jgi:hypothetical protein